VYSFHARYIPIFEIQLASAESDSYYYVEVLEYREAWQLLDGQHVALLANASTQ
jgi:hypothetical protein